MLGLDAVRGIVLSSAATEIASRRRSVHGLWEHSLGPLSPPLRSQELSVCRVGRSIGGCLMHDIGKLVLKPTGRDYDAVIAHAVKTVCRFATQSLLLGEPRCDRAVARQKVAITRLTRLTHCVPSYAR